MKKEHPPTLAAQLGPMTILTKRPEGMAYEDYRIIRKAQQKLLKYVLK